MLLSQSVQGDHVAILHSTSLGRMPGSHQIFLAHTQMGQNHGWHLSGPSDHLGVLAGLTGMEPQTFVFCWSSYNVCDQANMIYMHARSACINHQCIASPEEVFRWSCQTCSCTSRPSSSGTAGRSRSSPASSTAPIRRFIRPAQRGLTGGVLKAQRCCCCCCCCRCCCCHCR